MKQHHKAKPNKFKGNRHQVDKKHRDANSCTEQEIIAKLRSDALSQGR